MSSSVSSSAPPWQRIPFRSLLLVVVFLFVVRERYPFSNFPMYSNLDEEADVLYVTDQVDQALPMDAIFRTGSGTAKKMYKRELSALTKTAGRKPEDATSEDRAGAGRAVMATIMERMRRKEIPTTVSHLRLYRKTFRLGEGGLADLAPERLVDLPLPAP
jgi:hypothetical protein